MDKIQIPIFSPSPGIDQPLKLVDFIPSYPEARLDILPSNMPQIEINQEIERASFKNVVIDFENNQDFPVFRKLDKIKQAKIVVDTIHQAPPFSTIILPGIIISIKESIHLTKPICLRGRMGTILEMNSCNLIIDIKDPQADLQEPLHQFLVEL